MAAMSDHRVEMSVIDSIFYDAKTNFDGLVFLEKLCASGAWVPAWIVRDYLKDMTPRDKAMTLIIARRMGLRNASGLLEEAGADIFKLDQCGNTVLHISILQAAFIKDIVIVEDRIGSTTCNMPSYRVAKEEIILTEVKSLIRFERSLVTTGNHSNQLPLHVAAQEGLAQVVNVLIQAGSDVNALTNDRDTPINLAAKHGHLECLQLLLDMGADINISDRCGIIPFHWTVEYGHLHCAKILIEKGAEIDQFSKYGRCSPLHIGIQYGQAEIVEMLIQNKVKIDPVDVFGHTPLHLLAFRHHREQPDVDMMMLNLLIQGGASLNIKDNDGDTPLHLAVVRDNVTIVKGLIDAGADVSLTDSDDCTPLQVAEDINAEECVDILKKL